MRLDSPFHRMNVAEMTEEELRSHVEALRRRRMSAYNKYKEAQELLEKKKAYRTAEFLNKRFEQIERKFDTIDRSIQQLDKWVAEVIAASLSS